MADKVPQFVYIESKDMNKSTHILCTTHPYVIAQVWMFDTDDKLMDFKMRCKVPAVVQVLGFRILLVFHSSLVEVSSEYLRHSSMLSVLQQMTAFYLQDRITPHSPRYKKYKIEE